MNKRIIHLSAVSFILVLILLSGCKKELVSFRDKTPIEQFEYAKRFFDKKDFYKAKQQFTRVFLNNQGDPILEDTQFYLAESYFYSKEYILAIEEYRKLINSMPQSQYVDDSVYKISLAYFELSPKYALDQEYTVKAIDQLQIFLEDHSGSDLADKARVKLHECRNKLGLKEFKTGELYRRMGYPRSALMSFKEVLESYLDTDYVDDALYFMGDSYMVLGNLEDAEISFQKLLVEYGDSKYIEKAKNQLQKIQAELAKYQVRK